MKTGQANQLHALLIECGIVLPKGSTSLNKQILLIFEDAKNNLTSSVRSLVAQLKEPIDDLAIKISV